VEDYGVSVLYLEMRFLLLDASLHYMEFFTLHYSVGRKDCIQVLQLGVKVKVSEFGSFRQSDKLRRLENMIFLPICNFAFNSNLSFELKIFKMPRS